MRGRGRGSGRDGGRGGIGGLEGLYRRVTADRPDDARTCNVKSVLALENGRVADAAELMKMLGLFPGQEREYEPITAPPVPINRVGP